MMNARDLEAFKEATRTLIDRVNAHDSVHVHQTRPFRRIEKDGHTTYEPLDTVTTVITIVTAPKAV